MAIQNKRIELSGTEYLDHKPIKKDSIFSYVYAIIRLIIIIIQNIYCVSSYLILSWILLFPISWFSRDLYYKVENQQYNALMLIVSTWSLAGGMKIVETGDDFKQLIDGNLQSDEHKDVNDEQSNFKKQSNNNNQKTFITNDHGRPLKSVSDNNGKTYPNNYNNINVKNRKEQNCEERRNQDSVSKQSEDLKNNQNGRGREDTNLNEMTSNELANKKTAQLKHIQNITKQNLYSTMVNDIRKPRILFLCNHISTADVPLLMQALSTTKNLSIFWVLDAQVSF